MADHILFVDDSGMKEYAPNGGYGAHNSRHFVYGAILIETGRASSLINRLCARKLATFGDEAVEIKSNWLRIPNARQAMYLDAYGINDELLDEFVENYYRELESFEGVQFIATVVDKLHMQEDYPDNTWYPYAVAYESLAQRAELEMRIRGGTFLRHDGRHEREDSQGHPIPRQP